MPCQVEGLMHVQTKFNWVPRHRLKLKSIENAEVVCGQRIIGYMYCRRDRNHATSLLPKHPNNRTSTTRYAMPSLSLLATNDLAFSHRSIEPAQHVYGHKHSCKSD
jgi:hypothetical protein